MCYTVNTICPIWYTDQIGVKNANYCESISFINQSPYCHFSSNRINSHSLKHN